MPSMTRPGSDRQKLMKGTASAPCILRFLILKPVPPASAPMATPTITKTGMSMTHDAPPAVVQDAGRSRHERCQSSRTRVERSQEAGAGAPAASPAHVAV